jgi:putative transposase
MPNYRRNYVPGGTYFFTVVTYQRRPILTTALGRTCLRQALQEVGAGRHFTIDAVVLLPDHLHCLWTLPPRDHRYSLRWGKIKEAFTRTYLDAGGQEGRRTASRVRHRERAIWQRRFWEHTIRDEQDLKVHWITSIGTP